MHPGALPLGRQGPSRYRGGSGMGGPIGTERHGKSDKRLGRFRKPCSWLLWLRLLEEP